MKIFGLVALVPPAITLALWLDAGTAGGVMYQERIDLLVWAIKAQTLVVVVALIVWVYMTHLHETVWAVIRALPEALKEWWND